jgi:glyoxylase-like metal-dependent hydrolase (beta-lactamase superfamily II)
MNAPILDFGDMKVWRILDTEARGCPIEGTFPCAGAEDIARFRGELAPHYIDEDLGLAMSCQSFLLLVKGELYLIDGAVGNGKARSNWADGLRTGYLKSLEDAGYGPEDIGHVLTTHLHMDHVGWFTRGIGGRNELTFPRATHYFVREELESFEPGRSPKEGDTLRAFEDSVRPVIARGAYRVVEGSHHFNEALWLEPSYGHSPGHVCVRARSAGAELLFAGDAFHHPVQILDPGIRASAYDEDADAAEAARRRIIHDYKGSGAILLGSHFAARPALRIGVGEGSTRIEPC